MEFILRSRREAEQAEAPLAATEGTTKISTNGTNLDTTTGAPKSGLDKFGADIMAKVNECKYKSNFCFCLTLFI